MPDDRHQSPASIPRSAQQSSQPGISCGVELVKAYSNQSDLGNLAQKILSAPLSRRSKLAKPQVHKVRQRLTPEAQADLVASYQAGSSVNELCRQSGLGKGTVLRLLEAAGVETRKRPGLDIDQLAEAVRLYESGLSLADVGSTVGREQSTIHHALRRAGVTMRPPSAPGTKRPSQVEAVTTGRMVTLSMSDPMTLAAAWS